MPRWKLGKDHIFRLSVILDHLLVSAVLQALHTELKIGCVGAYSSQYRNALISVNLVCSYLVLIAVCAAVSPFKAHGSFYSYNQWKMCLVLML